MACFQPSTDLSSESNAPIAMRQNMRGERRQIRWNSTSKYQTRTLFNRIPLYQVFGIIEDKEDNTLPLIAMAFCTEHSRNGKSVYKDLFLNQVIFVAQQDLSDVCYNSLCFSSVFCVEPSSLITFSIIDSSRTIPDSFWGDKRIFFPPYMHVDKLFLSKRGHNDALNQTKSIIPSKFSFSSPHSAPESVQLFSPNSASLSMPNSSASVNSFDGSSPTASILSSMNAIELSVKEEEEGDDTDLSDSSTEVNLILPTQTNEDQKLNFGEFSVNQLKSTISHINKPIHTGVVYDSGTIPRPRRSDAARSMYIDKTPHNEISLLYRYLGLDDKEVEALHAEKISDTHTFMVCGSDVLAECGLRKETINRIENWKWSDDSWAKYCRIVASGPECRLSANSFITDKNYLTIADKRIIAAGAHAMYFDFNGGRNAFTWLMNHDIVEYFHYISHIPSYAVESQIIIAVGKKNPTREEEIHTRLRHLVSLGEWRPEGVTMFILFEDTNDHFWGIEGKIGAEVYDNSQAFAPFAKSNNRFTTDASFLKHLWNLFVINRSRAELVLDDGSLSATHNFNQ